MTLDLILKNEKDIKNKLCQLMREEDVEFENLKKKASANQKKGFNSFKSRLLRRKLNADDTNHTTYSGFYNSSFMKAEAKNHSLDMDGHYQLIDLSDMLLLKHFVDYAQKDKLVGTMPAIDAVVLDSLALYFASTPSYDSFTNAESWLFKKRKNIPEFIFGNEDSESKVIDLVVSLYDRMYDVWVGSQTDASIQLVNQSQDVAAELFIRSFDNRNLLGLIGLTSSKEEAKALKVVDKYISYISDDSSKRDLVEFLTNPIRLFLQKASDTNLDIWERLDELMELRHSEYDRKIDEFDSLSDKYGTYDVRSLAHVTEAETVITRLDSMLLSFSDIHDYDNVTKVTQLRTYLHNQVKELGEKLKIWGSELTDYEKWLEDADKTIYSIFDLNEFSDVEASNFAKINEKLDEVSLFLDSLVAEEFSERKNFVQEKTRKIKGEIEDSIVSYTDYIELESSKIEQTIESGTWTYSIGG